MFAWLVGSASGICLVVPQIVHTIRHGTAAGVSLGGLIASFLSWMCWVPYPLSNGDLRGVLGLVIPGCIQGVAVVVAWRYGAAQTSMRAPVYMCVLLGGALLFGGISWYFIALGTTTLWACGPAVLSAWREVDIGGISVGAWYASVIYGSAWLTYGALSGAGGFVYTGSLNIIFALLVLAAVWIRRSGDVTTTPELHGVVSEAGVRA